MVTDLVGLQISETVYTLSSFYFYSYHVDINVPGAGGIAKIS